MEGVPKEKIVEAMRGAHTIDPEELRNVGEFEDDIIREYDHVDDGLTLPWGKTHDLIKLREGETSLWAGMSGHGKSALVSHIVGWLALRDARCCVASMEFRTAQWLMRMNRQMCGVARPTDTFARRVNRELAKVMYAFDVSGRAKGQRILEVFRYSHRRYRTELFVIDNLTKCGFADDDYSGQKAFVEDLTDFARKTRTHVMIVAHMRKGEDENHPAGKMAVKGSGGVTDMVDTSIEIWRNKPRERAMKLLSENPTDEKAIKAAEKYERQGDTLLLVNKQRATGKEPTISLWFDQTSTQFLSNQDQKPSSLLSKSLTPVNESEAA
jgi:twinkle protein